MRIGLVGAGYWGAKALREYAALRDEGTLESVVVCDKSARSLARARREARLDGTTSSLSALLRRVDAVHVCVNNEQHYPVARKALEAGVHVLLEKPMTTSAHTAYDLAERASAAGLVLQAGHIYRFNNAIRTVQGLVGRRFFGSIYYCKFQWTTRMPPPPGLDIVWDLLPHPLDMMHLLTGEWPQEFVGVSRSYRRRGASEVAFINALYAHQLMVGLELSWLRPVRSRTLEIMGAKRDAIVDCANQKIDLVEDGQVRRLPVRANNTLRDEILHFLKSIRTGKNPLNSAIVGARNVHAIELAQKALR